MEPCGDVNKIETQSPLIPPRLLDVLRYVFKARDAAYLRKQMAEYPENYRHIAGVTDDNVITYREVPFAIVRALTEVRRALEPRTAGNPPGKGKA